MPDLMDNERVELHGMLAEFRQALEEEIHKVKSSGLSSMLLFAGTTQAPATSLFLPR